MPSDPTSSRGSGRRWSPARLHRRRAAGAATALAITLLVLAVVAVAFDDPRGEGGSADAGRSEPVSGDPGPDEPTVPGPAPSGHHLLDGGALPTDVEHLLAVLAEMPDELNGLERVPGQPDGEVLYGRAGDPALFLVAMEAEDMGVQDENNRELLEVEASSPGRHVTTRQTDPSKPVMYVGGAEGTPPDQVHFLLWTTADGPFFFAAGAYSAADLEALVTAFANALSSSS